jgi:hypothetical protein
MGDRRIVFRPVMQPSPTRPGSLPSLPSLPSVQNLLERGTHCGESIIGFVHSPGRNRASAWLAAFFSFSSNRAFVIDHRRRHRFGRRQTGVRNRGGTCQRHETLESIRSHRGLRRARESDRTANLYFAPLRVSHCRVGFAHRRGPPPWGTVGKAHPTRMSHRPPLRV